MTPTESTRRILVVDDEQSIVDAVPTAFRYEGYQVDEPSNGRDALSAYVGSIVMGVHTG